jgi:L-gulonolactone oxidase
LVNAGLVDLPLKIIQHSSYILDPSNCSIIYDKDDPGFEFYDWMSWMCPEGNWVALAREFLEPSERFRRQRVFTLPLPALIYFLKQDQASLLSRSRNGNMIALDPLYREPSDPK